MKFNTDDQELIRNFSTINPSISFTKGKKVRTISPNKTILAEGNLSADVGQPFAIYKLANFLGVLSLFEDADMDLKEKFMVISSGDKKVKYVYADTKSIVTPPNKDLPLNDPLFQFTLNENQVKEVLSAAAVIEAPELAFVDTGDKLLVKALDSRNPSFNEYVFTVSQKGAVTDSDDRIAYIKLENFKPMVLSYEITVYANGLIHLKNDKVQYWIPSEQNSSL